MPLPVLQQSGSHDEYKYDPTNTYIDATCTTGMQGCDVLGMHTRPLQQYAISLADVMMSHMHIHGCFLGCTAVASSK